MALRAAGLAHILARRRCDVEMAAEARARLGVATPLQALASETQEGLVVEDGAAMLASVAVVGVVAAAVAAARSHQMRPRATTPSTGDSKTNFC